MMKSKRTILRSTFILGLASLINWGALAERSPYMPSSQFLQCQTSLKRFFLHLERCKTRSNKAYYEDLYNQTQSFLSTLDNYPASPSRQSRCESLLRAIQDIVG